MTRHLIALTKSCVNQALYDRVYLREGWYRDGARPRPPGDREEAEPVPLT